MNEVEDVEVNQNLVGFNQEEEAKQPLLAG